VERGVFDSIAVMHNHLIRLATEADVPALTALLNHYIVNSTATFITEPQIPEERLAWLREHGAMHPVLVAELEGEVVGLGSLSAYRPRAAYSRTVEVSVYVHQAHHRRGIGRAIFSELIERARLLGHHVLIGVACSESTASVALMDAFEFTKVGHLSQVGRKFDRWLDTVIYQRLL
jgi:L-amino acid N-acyltransferase